MYTFKHECKYYCIAKSQEVIKMKYASKIMQIAKQNNGIITSREVTKKNIPRIYLKILVDKGKLERIERGVYSRPEVLDDEMFALQSRFKKGIFSHETALFLHNLTDRTPVRYAMTFPAGYNTSSVNKKNVIVYYSVNRLYKIGIISMPTPNGLKVNTYNAERTICELIQKRKKTDIQVTTSAIKSYMEQSKKDIPLLSEYATLFKVEKPLRYYLEVLS